MKKNTIYDCKNILRDNLIEIEMYNFVIRHSEINIKYIYFVMLIKIWNITNNRDWKINNKLIKSHARMK